MILGIAVTFIHRPHCIEPSFAAAFLGPNGIRYPLLQRKMIGKGQ